MRPITMTVYLFADDDENPHKWNVAEWLDDATVSGWTIEEGHGKCGMCDNNSHDIEPDHICWTDDTLCPECGSENDLPSALSSDGIVMVEWVSIGEGLQGEYDPDNPEDVELLRYDAYVRSIDPDTDEQRGLEIDFMRDGWGTLQDSSYCTQTPASTPRETLKQLAQLMADRLADKLDAGWKRTAEEMSWAHPDWVTPTN